MDQEQPKKKNNLIIILVVAGVFAFSAVACCGAALFFGFGAFSGMEKTYYAQCEYLEDSNACERCCRDRGHNGYAYGAFINEEDKTCGCL